MIVAGRSRLVAALAAFIAVALMLVLPSLGLIAALVLLSALLLAQLRNSE